MQEHGLEWVEEVGEKPVEDLPLHLLVDLNGCAAENVEALEEEVANQDLVEDGVEALAGDDDDGCHRVAHQSEESKASLYHDTESKTNLLSNQEFLLGGST